MIDVSFIEPSHVLGTVLIVSASIFAYLVRKFKCLDKQDKRGWRQSTALIILANRLDDIYQEQHGKKSNLGKEMETILKDDKGEL